MFIPTNSFIFINVVIILIFIIMILQGYKKGLIYQVLSLFSFVAALIISWILGPIFAKRFVLIEVGSNLTDGIIAVLLNQIIWYLIILIIAKVIFDIIVQISKIVSKIPLIGFFNKVLGAVFGIVNGLIVTVLLSSLFMMPIFKNGQEVREATYLSFFNNAANKIVLFISDNIDINKIIEDYNFDIQNGDIDEYRNIFENWMIEEGIFE